MFDKELLVNFRKIYNEEHPNEVPIKESDDIWKSLKQKLTALFLMIVSEFSNNTALPSAISIPTLFALAKPAL